MIKIILLIAIQFILVGCCMLKPIKVGEECVSYNQLCAGEHSFNKCAPDGILTKLFADGGLAVTDSIDGSEYLGSIWNPSKDAARKYPCLEDLGSNLYTTTYQKDSTIYTIKLNDIKAKIEGNIKGTLVTANIDNSPEVAASIAIDVSQTLQSENFDKFNFKILTVKDDVIEALDDHTSESYAKCFSKLDNDTNSYFIRSIAVIGSENKFNSISNTAVSTKIDAAIKNAKISGSTINADLAASLSVSVKTKIDQTINSEIKQHSRIYGLGFSLPVDISTTRYKDCEVKYGCKVNDSYLKSILYKNMIIQ